MKAIGYDVGLHSRAMLILSVLADFFLFAMKALMRKH